MNPDLKNESSLGLTPLINGIVEDAQKLITQQLSLFQCEIKEDLGRTKTAAIPLVTGMAVSLLAGIFLFTAMARLLMFEWPDLPDFAAYGIIGGVLAVLGTALVALGMNLANAIEAFPKTSVSLLKENAQWKTKT